MQRISLPEQNASPSFIGSWRMEPLSICDELISYFEGDESKQKRGETASGVQLDIKDTTDVVVMPSEINSTNNKALKMYFDNLFAFYQDYVTEWPFLEVFGSRLQIGNFLIKRYQSGQHFQHTHCERSSLETLHRLFAFMTYLNDVKIEDGGSTFFNHFDLEIQPQKGLTLIWPAEWTHAHRGNILKKGPKYIVSGWLHFPTE